MVARGEAVGGQDAELLEAERHAARHPVHPAADGDAHAAASAEGAAGEDKEEPARFQG